MGKKISEGKKRCAFDSREADLKLGGLLLIGAGRKGGWIMKSLKLDLKCAPKVHNNGARTRKGEKNYWGLPSRRGGSLRGNRGKISLGRSRPQRARRINATEGGVA